MKIDIIGSKFSRKLTEFKNFGFDVNNIVEGQSILSLLSKPYETTMKELNTTDLNDITVAYRDLNKLLYPEIKKSKSEIIMIDLLSELNEIVEYEGSYYNASSFELLSPQPSVNILTDIQKFRALYNHLNHLLEILNQYEKVIILKVLPNDENAYEFIHGLYKLIEDNVQHKLILTVDDGTLNDRLDAPIEIYSNVNQNLKKFSSDNYYNQLLFDELLESDTLSVYINHVEKREYVYELYKNGKPYKKSDPTTSRYYSYTLDESGKYRIRVTVTDQTVNPRFSLTYEYKTSNDRSHTSKTIEYIEMPEEKNFWMLETIIKHHSVSGLIGNAYLYPDGFKGYPVFLPEEINEVYLKKEALVEETINILSNLSDKDFDNFFKKHDKEIKKNNALLADFLKFIKESHKN